MSSLSTPYKVALLKKTFATRFLAKQLGIYFIMEYPKSGGTWMKNMLAMSLGVPAWTKDQTPFQSCVMLAHHTRANGIPLNKTVIMHRDGRDIMVSFYHHSYFYNDLSNRAHVDLMKRVLPFDDYHDVKSNLLAFMKFVFDTPASPKFSWRQFVNAWHGNPHVIHVKYEDLRKQSGDELLRVLNKLKPHGEWSKDFVDHVSREFNMKNMQSKQAELNKGIYGKQEAEKPFIREGSVGGWSSYFTDEALAWFEERAGEELLKLNYTLGRPENG